MMTSIFVFYLPHFSRSHPRHIVKIETKNRHKELKINREIYNGLLLPIFKHLPIKWPGRLQQDLKEWMPKLKRI